MRNKEKGLVFINGKFYKEGGQAVLDELEYILEKKGYSFFLGEYSSNSYITYVNKKKYQAACIQTATYTGYVDAKGNKLYLGDKIRYLDMEDTLNGTYPFEGYYIRHHYPPLPGHAWGKDIDYYFKSQEDFLKVEKIEDVLEKSPEFWDYTKQRIFLKEL